MKLLASKSLLHTCFTQNIDTLERRAGVPAEKIVEAHGSFASQRCIDCNRPYDSEKMKKIVMKSDIPRCEKCSGLVKPDIVFFGEGVRGLKNAQSVYKVKLLLNSCLPNFIELYQH